MAVVTELPGVPAPAPSPGLGPEPTGADAGKEKNDNWRFLEPQPVREDQVSTAVSFLSNPRVKGSPVASRRAFLERKGLSREEIDEAFRRVPDPPSDSSRTTIPTTVAQTGSAGPANTPVQVGQPITRQVPAKSASWTQMFLALGVLTAAGAGAGVLTKNYFIPRLKQWILDVASGKTTQGEQGKASKLSPVEEALNAAAVAAAASAAATTQVAGAIQEIVNSKSEDRLRLDSILRAVEAQTQELKNSLAGVKDVVQNAEVTKYQRSVTDTFQSNGGPSQEYRNGQTNGVRSTSITESQAVTTKPSNIGVASDPSTGVYNNRQQGKPLSPSPSNGAIHAPHSQSYLDVMAMLERGEKPPGIREVNDKPPNPNQPPSNTRLQPRPKPWEKAAAEARPISPAVSADNGQPGRYNESWNGGRSSEVQSSQSTEVAVGSGTGTSSEPWWRKKVNTDASFTSSAVKITEVDSATEASVGAVQIGQSSSSSSFQSGGGRAGWVPPAVPQPVFPGAEEAIRRPKSTPNPPQMGPAVGAPSFSQEGKSPAQSISQEGESPAQVDVSNDSVQAESELPEQRAEVPDEQEPDILERSLVEPNRTFKDVVQEGDE